MFYKLKNAISFLLVFCIASSAVCADLTVDQRINNLTLGTNALYFDASGENGSDPYMNVFYPKPLQVHVVKCSKDLKSFVGLSQLIQGYKAHTKKEEKHRESWIGQLIARIKKQVYKHPFDSNRLGQPLIDEYEIAVTENNGNFIFCIFLNAPEQLTQLASYFKKHFEKRGMAPASVKPLLAITVRQDPKLEQLDADSISFMRQYFSFIDYNDPRITKFVYESQRAMVRCGNELERGHPKYLESGAGTLLRMTEDKANDFSAKKIIPKLLFWGIGTITVGAYIKAFSSGWGEWLPGVKWIKEKFKGEDEKLEKFQEQLRQAQARNEALQQRLGALDVRVDGVVGDVAVAQARADTAVERADAAQGSANGAQVRADAAHTRAGDARDDAATAQQTAATAQQTAATAQQTAATARDVVRDVQERLETRADLQQAFQTVLQERKDAAPGGGD